MSSSIEKGSNVVNPEEYLSDPAVVLSAIGKGNDFTSEALRDEREFHENLDMETMYKIARLFSTEEHKSTVMQMILQTMEEDADFRESVLSSIPVSTRDFLEYLLSRP